MSRQEFGVLSDDWATVDEIIVFGCGVTAKTYLEDLDKVVTIRFIIDNAPEYEGILCHNIPIYNFAFAKDRIGNTKIVVIAETIANLEIVHFLEEQGYKEHEDFTGIERFVCEWGYKHFGKIWLLEVHTAITTKCTFNCKNCNMFIPYYKTKITYSLDQLKENVDMLFQYVDYICKYQILGGEPFLNDSLADYIEYIVEKYRKRIGHIRVITNGSVLPDAHLTEALKDCEVFVSDYTDEIDYTDKFEKVMEHLKEHNINYAAIPSLKWRDVGFPAHPCRFSNAEIREHMVSCGTSWHGLADKKLYYCNSSWSAEKCGLFTNVEDDYIELDKADDRREKSLAIIRMCLGETNTGYNSFCKLCGGCGPDNNKIIKAGVQS